MSINSRLLLTALTALALSASTTVHASSGDPACDFFMADLDGSDTVDARDIDVLYRWLFTGRGDFSLELADSNGDGDVNIADGMHIAAYLNAGGEAPFSRLVPGDANGDGAIDLADLIVLSHYLNGADVDVCMTGADMNRDSALDVADLSMLAAQL
jgi:hypothetical protein